MCLALNRQLRLYFESKCLGLGFSGALRDKYLCIVMPEFKVLKYNEYFMRWLGVHSYRFGKDTNEFLNSISTYLILLLSVCYVISSIAFTRINWPQFEIISGSCIVALSGTQTGGMFLSFGLKMKAVKSVHVKLQKIADEQGKFKPRLLLTFKWTHCFSIDPNTDTWKIYREVEEKCRIYTIRMAIFFILDQLMTIAAFFFSIYCIFVGQTDTQAWLLPFKFAVPFNTKIIWKWYFLWLYNLLANLAYAGIITAVSAYFVCCCLYIDGICDHFGLLIGSLQSNIGSKTGNKFREMKKSFAKAVEIQVETLEWVKCSDE